MTSDFFWDEVYRRRRAFAGEIAKKLDLSFGLTGGIKEPFDCPASDHDFYFAQFIADQPMRRMPFLMVGQRMTAWKYHAIDHAWWLLAGDRTGFVTEPYMPLEKAEAMALELSDQCSRWGVKVKVEVWPPEKSPWPRTTTERERRRRLAKHSSSHCGSVP
ncbi:MAG: hypothetical protein J2P48_14655 [Alphaproteobacteria bacterium]|nr:hypothetical protein [Alphaproteobacteria bacterium]